MSLLDDAARVVIKTALKKMYDSYEVCQFYGITKKVLIDYIKGKDNGSLNARKVMSVELRRVEEKRKGNFKWVPGDADRYKGGRGR